MYQLPLCQRRFVLFCSIAPILISLHLVASCHGADEETLRSLKLRTHASRADVESGREYLDTPVGIAFLEFNSRIGIPVDVWVTITTAYICCVTCQLVRTFPAHRAHLDSHDICYDLGEGVATLAKGKGKERSLEDDRLTVTVELAAE
jgi:hypothetical protein